MTDPDSTDFTLDELDRRNGRRAKKRKGGTQPPLDRATLDDPAGLRRWLSDALDAPAGWTVNAFERTSADDLAQPCTLVLVNGREERRYRFRTQYDLSTVARLEVGLPSVTAGLMRPRLNARAGEGRDVWGALCRLASDAVDAAELEQAREWLESLLEVARTIEGFSLANVAERRDALLMLRSTGQFTRLDALAIVKHPEDAWPRRPICVIDSDSREFWVRAGEAAVYLRTIIGATVRDRTLEARWREIGVEHCRFQDRRPPHPKANVYRVPRGFLTDPGEGLTA